MFEILSKLVNRQRFPLDFIKSKVGWEFTERDGIKWRLVHYNDLGVPYFSKVSRNGTAQKKQFTCGAYESMLQNDLTRT